MHSGDERNWVLSFLVHQKVNNSIFLNQFLFPNFLLEYKETKTMGYEPKFPELAGLINTLTVSIARLLPPNPKLTACYFLLLSIPFLSFSLSLPNSPLWS